MLLSYGMRAGEITGLRWSDIDLINDIFVIRQQINRVKGKLRVSIVKTDASRRQLPLIPVVKQAMLERIQQNNIQVLPFDPNRALTLDDLVTTTELGTPVEPNNFRERCFYKRLEECGLPRITVHNLRHVAATLLKEAGIPVKDVQEILGHTDIKTTLKIYTHGSDNIKREALAGIGNQLVGEGLELPNPTATCLPESAGYRISCSQNAQSNAKKIVDKIKSPLLNKGAYESCYQAYESTALTS